MSSSFLKSVLLWGLGLFFVSAAFFIWKAPEGNSSEGFFGGVFSQELYFFVLYLYFVCSFSCHFYKEISIFFSWLTSSIEKDGKSPFRVLLEGVLKVVLWLMVVIMVLFTIFIILLFIQVIWFPEDEDWAMTSLVYFILGVLLLIFLFLIGME